MIIIYINVILTLVLSLFIFSRKTIQNKAYSVLLIFYFVLASCLQKGSPDFNSYKLIYNGAYVRDVEPVYRYTVLFFYKILHCPFSLFWGLQGCFLGILVYKIINYYSSNKLLSTILFMNIYFPIKQLIQVRNCISICLFLTAGILYLENYKKIWKVNWLISAGTHFSGIPSIIAFSKKDSHAKFMFFSFLLSIIFLFVPLSKIVATIINKSHISNTLLLYYVEWVLNENYMGKTIFHIGRISIIILLSYLKKDEWNLKTRFIFNIFVIGGIFRFLFSSAGELALRISETFLFSEIILIPNIISLMKKKSIFYAITILYSFLMLFLFIRSTPTFITSYTWNIF